MTSRVSKEMAAAVFTRDGYACVAPLLGGSSMDCWGRNRLEHVQDGYGRMGLRAKSDMAHLATLCEGHTEPGMRGGYVWCTDARNRERLREYLRSFAPVDPLQLKETGL
jgi:hypothetical protein